MDDFNLINEKSELSWAFRSQITKFIKRFLTDPYREDDKEWILSQTSKHGVRIKNKLAELSKLV